MPILIICSIVAPDNQMFGDEGGMLGKLRSTGAAPQPSGAEQMVKAIKGAANLSLDPLDHLPQDLCQLCKTYIMSD